tara:strand:- start:503 stop:970 length:468 start_codon:yes stop_codon:yes gene_type:complete
MKKIISQVNHIISPLKKLIDDIISQSVYNKAILIFASITIIAIVIAIIYMFIIQPNQITYSNLTGGNRETTFILYYVEWCPHCQIVKPEWEKLENDKELKKNINIIKINCEENEDVVKEKNIEGFPTILLTHNGKEIGYNGAREYSDFKQYLLSL